MVLPGIKNSLCLYIPMKLYCLFLVCIYILVTEWLKLSFTSLSTSYSVPCPALPPKLCWDTWFCAYIVNSNRNWVINGLLDHFPDSVHHTSTDPAFLTQLKKKERVSGEVWLKQDKPAESLKEIYGKLWPQQRSVTSTSSFTLW